MKKNTHYIHVAAIAEHHADDALFCTILKSETGKGLLEEINKYFAEEEAEGHRVDGFPLLRLPESLGLDMYDIYTDRHYRMTIERYGG